MTPVEIARRYRKHAGYAAVFVVFFALGLRQTFPVQAVRERMVLELAASGWQVKVSDQGPGGFLGVHFSGVTFESRDGASFVVDDLWASPRLLPYLIGRRGIDFDARLYGGRVRGLAEDRRGAQRLAVRATSLDLQKATGLRRLTGIDLAGTLEGDVDVVLDAREPARSKGAVDLKVSRGAVLGGQIQVAALGGALSLPRADLGQVVAQAQVADGKATFQKLEAVSPDLEVACEGLAVTLQPRLAYSPIFGRARLKIGDGFWQKSGTAALRGVAESTLAPARGRDGFYWFQITGTLLAPQPRPAGT